MKSLKYILVLTAVFIGQHLHASEMGRTLNESADSQLQQGLETLVTGLQLAEAIRSQELALVLVIVTDPDSPRLAELNGRNMMYAASLPKIAILLGAAVAVEEGCLKLDNRLQTELYDMIRHSCNDCANRVLDLIGRQELLTVLQSPEFGLYDIKGSGGLWVGKDYGPTAAYQLDPLAGLSHGATAFQTARFYLKLQTGTLVSPTQSKMMLDVLSNPAIPHKFVKGLAAYPQLEIFRKSGTWKTYHADSALVRTNGLAYIMVALANNEKGAEWLEQLAASMHELAVSTKAKQP